MNEFKPPLAVNKLSASMLELQDAVIGYIAEAGLAVLHFEVDGDCFLLVCEGRAYDVVKSLKTSSIDVSGVLWGDLYLQAVNWAKTQECWEQISTHQQKIRHAFARGCHVLRQIEHIQKR
jgi:hypothetical protein